MFFIVHITMALLSADFWSLPCPGDNGKPWHNDTSVGLGSWQVAGHSDQPQEERPIFGHSSNTVNMPGQVLLQRMF